MNRPDISTFSTLLFRLSIWLMGAAFVSFTPSAFADTSDFSTGAKPRFGLWVESEGANRPFETLEGFKRYLEFSKKGKFSDLYCQVYRGGRSWYPSMLADDAPYRAAMLEGFDPLQDSIAAAHARGQRLHAWVNVFRIWHNRRAPLLRTVGKSAVLVDNYGHSLLDYSAAGSPPGNVGNRFKLGTPALWLDPANPAVRKYLLETIKELVLTYPQLDGLHLDMIRYPIGIHADPARPSSKRLHFGYSKAAVEQFYHERNIENPSVPFKKGVYRATPSGEEWSGWRREQVSSFVVSVRRLLDRYAPHMELSGAVIAWTDRAVNNAFQDWPNWLSDRSLDRVIPMAYTRGNNTISQLSKRSVSYSPRKKPFVGLGAWLMLGDSSRLQRQTHNALNAGAAGVVLFSYSNLLESRGEGLVRDVYDVLSRQ